MEILKLLLKTSIKIVKFVFFIISLPIIFIIGLTSGFAKGITGQDEEDEPTIITIYDERTETISNNENRK